jgi:hypothetical protein
MSDEQTTQAKAPKAKKEKPPAVEDKPFAEFITEHFMPNLTQTLGNLGIEDLNLQFEAAAKLPVPGAEDAGACPQVIGKLQNSQRTFIVGFLNEDIKGQKFFCCADHGAHPSTLESFMIDERKVTLDLLVLYTIQRLNGQKWLTRN